MSYITYKVRVYDNGYREWWVNGQRHRENGPAVAFDRGVSLWDVVDALPEHSSDLVQRELGKLAGNRKSDITWNGRKGPASKYTRFRAGGEL